MRPELFRVFYLDIGFPAYFGLLLTGFLFATALGSMWARRIGQDPDVIVDLGLACLLMGVVGGRLLHVIADGYFWDYVHLCIDPTKVDWPYNEAQCGQLVPRGSGLNVFGWYPFGQEERVARGVWDAARGVCHPPAQDCFAWAKFWQGGLAYYGGFIGSSLMAVYLLKRDRFPFWKAADMAGFAVPLGLGFGRMGCLLAGCCFGVRTDGPLGLAFPANSPASEAQWKLSELPGMNHVSHPVHPTQIYESAVSFGIAAFCLLYVHGRKRYDGQVFVSFLALYAIGRFLLEFLRADDRGALLGLSTSQLIGLAICGLAFALHKHRTRSSQATPPASPTAKTAAAS
ncbi:prolipoprotein diacylglyceryl transferase [Polyangium jinanense]|uniref:Phosphatidylglycerol--prolipoprotein diacylglyceryl transferase n=1 Tax=Polyangium jinanense TaxID=2829994 RepID=A0A9X3XGA5_9BACT|nr:prolipoprotein diacylglyceryl transferase [Polyangium jinanense]MDC3957759.1 prolipoprotein diacylglyceryl transferase [Polyangium jinanense]MDC3987551.1 prolipoprotein diacylglyceryl transferase [Polyangium jinanense]